MPSLVRRMAREIEPIIEHTVLQILSSVADCRPARRVRFCELEWGLQRACSSRSSNAEWAWYVGRMRLPEPRGSDTWSRIRAHDIEELWDHSLAPHIAAAYADRVNLVCRLIARNAVPNCDVIDVGCAQGTIGLRLAEQGYRVSLLDIRAEALEYARERYESGAVEFIAGHIDDMIDAQRTFDVVVCTEVLEHLPRPGEMLLKMGRILRPGGAVILTTPNADYALTRLPSFGSAPQEVIESSERDSMDGDAHRYFFTKEELTAIVRSAGLRVRESGFFSPFWLQGHLKTRVAHRALYRLRKKIIVPPQSMTIGAGHVARAMFSGMWLVAGDAR